MIPCGRSVPQISQASGLRQRRPRKREKSASQELSSAPVLDSKGGEVSIRDEVSGRTQRFDEVAEHALVALPGVHDRRVGLCEPGLDEVQSFRGCKGSLEDADRVFKRRNASSTIQANPMVSVPYRAFSTQGRALPCNGASSLTAYISGLASTSFTCAIAVCEPVLHLPSPPPGPAPCPSGTRVEIPCERLNDSPRSRINLRSNISTSGSRVTVVLMQS